MKNYDENIKERLDLSFYRISTIKEDEKNIYSSFFLELVEIIENSFEFYEKTKENYLDKEEYFLLQNKLYKGLLIENYPLSIDNPKYLGEVFSKDLSESFFALVFEIRSIIKLLFDDRLEEVCAVLELFLEIYNLSLSKDFKTKDIKEIIYFYAFDYLDTSVSKRTKEIFIDGNSHFLKILSEENLRDYRYLFKLGEFVKESDIFMVNFLANLSEKDLDLIASKVVDGYKRGFEVLGKKLEDKRYVNISSYLGFELLLKKVIDKLASINLEPLIYRKAYKLADVSSVNYGSFISIINEQYEIDTKYINQIFFDKAYVDRKLNELKLSYEENKDKLKLYSGVICVDIFGQEEFFSSNNEYIPSYNSKQKKLYTSYTAEYNKIKNAYIKASETSFSISAWPIVDIAKNEKEYEEIFREFIKINTLENSEYEKIQQKIIDVLDLGKFVCIKGKKDNKTDIKISLHKIQDREKETNFENCLSDVNIPLGEVFTSPVLKGSTGVLHTKNVILKDINFKDLEIEFVDGMIKNYTCKNFEDEKSSKKFIEDILLAGHKTLPIGEFAIGTNTLAYVVGKKYNINSKYPILIAEKTGPHFAIGDTCYSYEEDFATYNSNGKRIIAKDNEVSILRKEDSEKAYFSTHTDITLPYDELESIYVVTESNEEIYIFKNDRFVLKGLDKLNEVF